MLLRYVSPRQDDADDFFRAGFLEDFRTLLEGGAGGVDVVDEPDDFSAEGSFLKRFREAERAGEVAPAFLGALRFRLREGEALSEEDGFFYGDRELVEGALRKLAGEEGGLVESAVAPPPRVERDGDDEIRDREIGMCHGVREDTAQGLREFVDEFVFEDVYRLGERAAPVGGGDEDAVERGLLAAAEARFAVRGLRTTADEALLLEEGMDAPHAFLAEPFAGRTAADAGAREEEIAEVFAEERDGVHC